MIDVIRGVWTLFFALALIMIGNGLQGSLLGLRATLEGFTTTETGLVMSSYYAGFLLSSFVMPRLIQDVGHIRVFAGFASIASTTVLMHALFPSPLMWLFMRFLTGFALAGLYVVSESWLNASATNANRGRLLSLYMATTYACLAGGQLLLAVVEPANYEPFILVSVLVSMALVPISLTRAPAPQIDTVEPFGTRELYRVSPLGFVACLLVGLSQGALLGMGSVYGKIIGLSNPQIAVLMCLPFIVVVCVLFPLGIVSDRFDRRWTIFWLNLVVGVLALAAAVPGPETAWLLIALFAAYGGLSAPVYSLAVAHTNDNLAREKMLSASARLVFVFGIGSVAGPIAAGWAMSTFGSGAFFMLGALAHLGIAAYAIVRMTKREAVPVEERTEFAALGVRPTPVGAAAAVEGANAQGDD